jgi:two-component system, NtrC family, sensor kinase
MPVSPGSEGRSPAVVYVDADPGQLRLFDSQFSERFRVTLCSSARSVLDQVPSVGPVAALLTDQRAGWELLKTAPSVLPDAERLMVTGGAELSAARAAVERGEVKRYFVKPWIPGEVGAALEDAIRIFELRSAVRQLRSRLQSSERLATLGRVSAGVAHDVAGPAAYIAQNAMTLRRELVGVANYVRRVSRIRPDPRVLDQLREIAEIAQDIEAGAEHVRQVSRGITGQLRSDPPGTRCEIPAVVHQVAQLVRPQLQGRASLRLIGGPLEVTASPLRLTQVLINLVVNAAQALASVERVESGRIEIRWSAQGERVRIEVEDDGPGLPQAVSEALFEPLVTTKAPETGTGLGLSLCQELVLGMGGELTLYSSAGHGTTATIDLPRAT